MIKSTHGAVIGFLSGLATGTLGAYKDTTFEGFQLATFFRSPALGALYGTIGANLFKKNDSKLLLGAFAASSERLTIEAWKAVTRKTPGKFAWGEELDRGWLLKRLKGEPVRRLLTASPGNSLNQYYDLKADVRRDGDYHSIRELVTPDQEKVREVARVLVQADDFPAAAQDFVASFTAYRREIGDFWATPGETLEAQTLRREEGKEFSCDCDDMAILLCSILRNYIPPEDVFCAIGTLDGEGHMYLVQSDPSGEDRVIEATAPSFRPVRGKYKLYAIFNDKYAFAYPEGIREFCLKPVEEEVPA